MKAISLMSISILSFSIFTRNPAALYAVSTMIEIDLFCKVTLKLQFIFSTNVNPQHSRGTVLCIKHFPLRNINQHNSSTEMLQVQFVVIRNICCYAL